MNLFDLFENDDSGSESITESGLPFGAQIYDKRTKEYIWSDFNSWKSAAEQAGLAVKDELGKNSGYGVTHNLIDQRPGDNQGDNEGSWVASPKYWGRSPFDGEGNPAKTPFGWINKLYLDSVAQQAEGHELDEKSSAKLGAKLGSRLVNRRQAHALTTKFRKPKLNFEEDDEVQTVFKPGDRVMYMRNLATVITCNGNTCGIEIDRHPGTMMVPTHMVKKPSYDESIEEQNLDEILAPSQLAKLQSIRAQLPKAGGQKPSIPSDADRAEADAWLNKLKNKDPVSATKSGEDPLNFDRPGRPRQASYHEIQGKIEILKSIKDLLKSIDKTEPRAMRSANKFGGADEITTKSQMMHDVVDNLNLNYTNEQELESIKRRLSEYLQQLVAKSAAWKKPTKPSKHGAVTIIKPGEGGEISEGNDDDYPDYEDDEIDPDAGVMGTPEFRKGLERLKQLANYGKPKDSTEKEQEIKKKVNEDGSGSVTAHGYRYNQQDQRVSWTRDFASEAQAKEWARRGNATVLSIIPKESKPRVAEGTITKTPTGIKHTGSYGTDEHDPYKSWDRSKTRGRPTKSNYVGRNVDIDEPKQIYGAPKLGIQIKSTPSSPVVSRSHVSATSPIASSGLAFDLPQHVQDKIYAQSDFDQDKRNFGTIGKTKKPDGETPMLDLDEAESRFTLYINGNPQTHHATAEEARRFAETVKLKYPDVKIEIKQEMREDYAQLDELSKGVIKDYFPKGATRARKLARSGNIKDLEKGEQFANVHAKRAFTKLRDPNYGNATAKKQGEKDDIEENMDSAAHNPSGAKFGGYYKGTQKGAPRAGQGFGSMEEGIAGNMTVRSDPLTKLKKHKNLKLRRADRFKGNPNRNNLVKAEAAKNATVTKPPMATKNPVAKFAQSVAKGAGKHQANDFKSQIKGLDRKTKHKGKDKFGLGESPNFLTWAMTAGYNVVGNPKVYEDAKSIYNNLLNEDKSDLNPGQYYVWTVHFDDGSSKKVKINDEKFDVTKYYADKNQVVVNVDYYWEPQGK